MSREFIIAGEAFPLDGTTSDGDHTAILSRLTALEANLPRKEYVEQPELLAVDWVDHDLDANALDFGSYDSKINLINGTTKQIVNMPTPGGVNIGKVTAIKNSTQIAQSVYPGSPQSRNTATGVLEDPAGLVNIDPDEIIVLRAVSAFIVEYTIYTTRAAVVTPSPETGHAATDALDDVFKSEGADGKKWANRDAIISEALLTKTTIGPVYIAKDTWVYAMWRGSGQAANAFFNVLTRAGSFVPIDGGIVAGTVPAHLAQTGTGMQVWIRREGNENTLQAFMKTSAQCLFWAVCRDV